MTLAVRCGTLVDGTGADPVRDATLLVEGGTIVGIQADGGVPAGADVLDASHLTVLPGMIDCHVHLMSWPQSTEERLLTPVSLRIAHALDQARITLEAGVTSVRDAGGAPRGVKMAIDQGLFPGPRTRLAVGFLSQTGGHGDSTMPNGVNIHPHHPDYLTLVADGVDQVRRASRELIRAGADQLKVHTSGGVMSPTDEPGATGFSPEEIAAIVYEARAAGKGTMAHAQATQGIKNAVFAGVESIEHGIYLDEETADEMVRRGTYLVPTLVAPLWVLRRAEEKPGSVPPYAVRKTHEVLQAHKANLSMAIQKGVKVAMGTDSGVGRHGTNLEELERLVEAGMTPMQAIVASTKVAAECSRLDKLVGTLEPGKRADLIAVAGDPLSNIRVLQDAGCLQLIVKDGKTVRRTPV